MTRLERKVRREIPRGSRPLVVILEPNPAGAILEIREKGRRSGFAVPVASLYTMLALRAADLARVERKRRRA